MNSNFEKLTEQLQPAFERLMAMEPVRNGRFNGSVPKRGVYLLSEPDNGHLYVGRSNDIRARYGRHCNPGATHRMAAFAFKLAREATGKVKASYKAGPDSRAGLMKDAKFVAAFNKAKDRIHGMDFRFVEEVNPIRQCLLEIYVAVEMETPYNSFDNH